MIDDVHACIPKAICLPASEQTTNIKESITFNKVFITLKCFFLSVLSNLGLNEKRMGELRVINCNYTACLSLSTPNVYTTPKPALQWFCFLIECINEQHLYNAIWIQCVYLTHVSTVWSQLSSVFLVIKTLSLWNSLHSAFLNELICFDQISSKGGCEWHQHISGSIIKVCQATYSSSGEEESGGRERGRESACLGLFVWQ